MRLGSLLLFSLMLFILPMYAQVNRTIDGFGNNELNPEWGAAHAPFQRVTENAFADGYAAPAGADRPNPRLISNAISSQTEFMPNEKGLSDFIWGWGQFIDHDINLNDDHPTEHLPIAVPAGDFMFDPGGNGGVEIPMRRSKFDPDTGTEPGNMRIHINDITAFIDGSPVYGSTEDRTDWLRTHEGGKLKVSAGNFLPFNTLTGEEDGEVDPNAPFMIFDGVFFPDKFYIAGDIRANEQPTLMAFHTLMVREHNRLCDEFAAAHTEWDDEEIFQRARKMVGAYMQAITYQEFLPAIGIELSPYSGYKNYVNPAIFNVFSAAAYRFGHTMVNGRVLRYEENGDTLSFGSIHLRDAFFHPEILTEQGGIAPFFRGMAIKQHQFVDPLIMDDLRNFLFGPPGYGGLDLLSINIQRARERGVSDYNTSRQDFGLPAITDFNEITSDSDIYNSLTGVYDDVNKIDPWIGIMAEDHLPNATIGQTLYNILKQQFEQLRDGDWYYYMNDDQLTAEEKQAITYTTLADVIKRNTSVEEIQDNVFFAEDRQVVAVETLPFEGIRNISLEAFPNPAQRYFTLNIHAMQTGDATLSIIDNTGRTVQQHGINLNKGKNILEFELPAQLVGGLYTLLLEMDGDTGFVKLMKGK